MNAIFNFKTGLLAATFAMACATTSAHRRPLPHRSHHATVMEHSAATAHANNSFSQHGRLAMAVAYLKNNHWLSVSKYARMTGLCRTMAKAELDGFANDRHKPIIAIIKRSKTVYTLR